MGLWQPDVQRKKTGLGAKSEDGKHESDGPPKRSQVLLTHIGEGVITRIRLQQSEAHQDSQGTNVGHQHVQVPRLTNLRNAMVGHDKKKRRKRHRLPHHHEHISIIGYHHHGDAGKKHVVLQTDQSWRRTLTLAEIPCREG